MVKVSITSAPGCGFVFLCSTASQFGHTLVAKWDEPKTSHAEIARSLCNAERGIVVASDFSEDGTLAVIRLTECAVDFS